MLQSFACRLINKQKFLWSRSVLKWPKRCFSNKSYFTSADIRSAFINYFRKHDHQFVPSSKVYSDIDDSLLFINAGMNQFKPIFLETDKCLDSFTYKRAVNSQKCIRVGGKHNDLEVVGKDLTHHTFFEMLGSWSFGDYFKKDACQFAWKVLTEVFQLPIENLYVTYFGGCASLNLKPDLETRDIWKDIGVSDDRIFPFGAAHNFWEMGDLGPCGPCTEIHYDQVGNRYAPNEVNLDGSDIIEIWNLVFMQYNRTGPSELKDLKRFHVDTGMGLERITAVLQGKTSNYDTDLFQPIIKKIEEFGTCPTYQGKVGDSDECGVDAAYRIISDHVRMITIAIGDGIYPGPRNRDRIVKRLLHRALKAGSETLNLPKMFMERLVLVVIDGLKDAYPDLADQQPNILDAVNNAELAYYKVLEEGNKIVEKTLKKMLPDEKLFPTDVALQLLFILGYPQEHLTSRLSESNKVFDQAATNQFYKEKHSRPPQQMMDKLNKEKELKSNLMQSLMSMNLDKTTVLSSSYLHGENHKTLSPIEANILAVFDQDGNVMSTANFNSTCAYILFDKSCFFHPLKKSLTSIGKLKSSNGITCSVDEVLSVEDWLLHRISWSEITTSNFYINACITLFPNVTEWLPYLRTFCAGSILNSEKSNLISGKIIQKIGGFEKDRLRIEISSVVDPNEVLELESSINELFQEQSAKHLSIIGEHLTNENDAVLFFQDLKPFVIFKHKTEAKSRTYLHCVIGNRAKLSTNASNELHSIANDLVAKFETLSEENLETILSLHKKVGKMIASVNKAEINFSGKIELKKTLGYLSSRLNTMKRKATKLSKAV